MTPAQAQKFDQFMNGPVNVGVFPTPRGKVIELIADGEISDSNFELGADERDYLNFLRSKNSSTVAQVTSQLPNEKLREEYKKARIDKFPILENFVDEHDENSARATLARYAKADDKNLAVRAIQAMKEDVPSYSPQEIKIDHLQSELGDGKISPTEAYKQAFDSTYGAISGSQEFSNLMDAKKN